MLIALQKLKQLNPQDNQESRKQFLTNFDLTKSTLDTEAQKAIKEILVDSHVIFARHRFDIGNKNNFKVKLTPIGEVPAYSQNLPTPINLKEDITVELASLHKYGIITTLPFSKHASSTFAQTATYVFLYNYVKLIF